MESLLIGVLLDIAQQRKAKLEGCVQTLAEACRQADRSKGGHPPHAAEMLVRMVFLVDQNLPTQPRLAC